MKKTLSIAVLVFMACLLCTSCKTSQQNAGKLYGQVEESTEIILPFSGKEYKSDSNYFRAVNQGKSPDMATANYRGVSQVRPTVEKAISQLLGIPNTTTSAGTDKHFTVNGVTFKMVFVQGGGLYLGCTSGSGSCDSDEIPSHYVTLSDYYVGETEVTQALWEAVMGYNKNLSHWQGDRLPVEMVSWTDCNECVSRLNFFLAEQLPQGYRFALPSEAQWEYAARGGQKSSGRLYAGSKNVSFMALAWFSGNCGSRTHEVKLKVPNELGLYDMSGNVWEWCEDWYSSSWYSDNVNWTDPVNAFAGSNRVLRGGSWLGNASYCRVSNRNFNTPSFHGYGSGFRLALVQE